MCPIGWEKLGHDNKRGNDPITIQEGADVVAVWSSAQAHEQQHLQMSC